MKIIKKLSNIFTFLKPSKKEKHKTLLLVGSHGETISIRRFFGLTVFTTIVSVVTLFAIGYLLIVSSGLKKENAELTEALDEYKQKAKYLKNENDILMARLVVAAEGQSELFEAQEPTTDTSPRTPRAAEPSPMPLDPLNVDALNIEEEIEKASRQLEDEKRAKKTIDVENLTVTHEVNSKTLRVRFDLRNIDPDLTPVSGRTVVILKTDDQIYKNWLTLPFVPLVSGEPASTTTGRSFLISRFKTVKFSITGQTNPNRYKTATVFVFSKSGEQLLEEDFTIHVKEILASSHGQEES